MKWTIISRFRCKLLLLTTILHYHDGSIDNVDQMVVHRLDMAISGIIMYALCIKTLQQLHVTFRDRKVQRKNLK